MIFPFDPREGVIRVPARLLGPRGDTIALLILDTGATSSMISWKVATLLGYDPGEVVEQTRIVTASGEENARQVTVTKIEVLNYERDNFHILCHSLPRGADADGVLGLDFFRGRILALDFRAGKCSE